MVVLFSPYLKRRNIALECIDNDLNYTMYISWLIQVVPLEQFDEMALSLNKYISLGGKP